MSALGQRTFTQVFNTARSVLNDTAGDIYTDSVLIEKGALAFLNIERAFRKHSIELGQAITTSGASYAANALTLNVSTALDIAEPVEIWQRFSSTDEWTQVERVDAIIPDPVNLPNFLTFWEWDRAVTGANSAGTFRVNACNRNMSIWLRYEIEPTYPVAGAVVGFDDFYLPLAYETAAIAAGSTGRANLAGEAAGKAKAALEDALVIGVHQKQGVRRSPVPYRIPRRRSRFGFL